MSFLSPQQEENSSGVEDSHLTQIENLDTQIPSFASKLEEIDLIPFAPNKIDVLQINLGKMCNQVCKHCHVDAGPNRKEIMSFETMMQCLEAMNGSSIRTIDLTGGAPEMNPHFRWFVEELSLLGKEVIVRCNLTIILANPKYHDLPEFFKEHNLHVVSSLPYFSARRTDAQRGDGVFDRSIQALKKLNNVGYGMNGTDLIMDLVYNPTGAFLPDDQIGLEKEFKKKLKDEYAIEFNELLAITNLPVSRFLEFLINSGNYEKYMSELVNSFNPIAAKNAMCRNMVSVGWDGFLYDCDFNQMLDYKIQAVDHISQFDVKRLEERQIIVDQHCYGCTAGMGSSCGGSLV